MVSVSGSNPCSVMKLTSSAWLKSRAVTLLITLSVPAETHLIPVGLPLPRFYCGAVLMFASSDLGIVHLVVFLMILFLFLNF